MGWRENEMMHLIKDNSGDSKEKGRYCKGGGAWIWKSGAVIKQVQSYGKKYGRV